MKRNLTRSSQIFWGRCKLRSIIWLISGQLQRIRWRIIRQCTQWWCKVRIHKFKHHYGNQRRQQWPSRDQRELFTQSLVTLILSDSYKTRDSQKSCNQSRLWARLLSLVSFQTRPETLWVQTPLVLSNRCRELIISKELTYLNQVFLQLTNQST